MLHILLHQTDLKDTCNSQSAVKRAINSDVVIHECSFGENQAEEARECKHSIPLIAATFARDVNAKLLVLTHISPFCKEKMLNIKNSAQKYFPRKQIIIAYDSLKLYRSKDGQFIQMIKY